MNKIVRYHETYSPFLKAYSDSQQDLVEKQIKPYLLKNIPMNEDFSSKMDINKLDLDSLFFNNLITIKITGVKKINERIQLCRSELNEILELLDDAIAKM